MQIPSYRSYGPVPSAQGWTLFVAHLQRHVTEDTLEEALLGDDQGHIVQTRIHRDTRTMENKGYALVVFREREAAQDAINRWHGSQDPILAEQGASLGVSWAFVKPSSTN